MFSLLAALSISAQTNTITIDWSFNSTPSASGNANASRTIEVGDTVTWNWYATGTHNVNSKAGSAENFESEFFGNGGTFSYTFTTVGTNDYICDPHPSNMFGTITVVAEGTLSVDGFDALGGINIYPNPTASDLMIDFSNQDEAVLNVKVYNLLGKELLSAQIAKNDAAIETSKLNNGVYMVKISSLDNKKTTTKRFVKI